MRTPKILAELLELVDGTDVLGCMLAHGASRDGLRNLERFMPKLGYRRPELSW